MTEVDPLYSGIRCYVDTQYEVSDPEAEITDEQAKEFFDRLRELAPPAEMELDLSEVEELREQGFSDDEIVEFFASLTAEDHFEIFGSTVYISTLDSITDGSWDSAMLSVTTKLADYDTREVVERVRASVFVHGQSQQATHGFEQGVAEYIQKPRPTPEQMLIRHLFPEPPEDIARRLELLRASRQLARDSGNHDFTQTRWVQAMTVLDMTALLKELGIKSTNELNW